jgi:hypothetical protein
VYQCWWKTCREINVFFPGFEYHMFYVLYPIVIYLLIRPPTDVIFVQRPFKTKITFDSCVHTLMFATPLALRMREEYCVLKRSWMITYIFLQKQLVPYVRKRWFQSRLTNFHGSEGRTIDSNQSGNTNLDWPRFARFSTSFPRSQCSDTA